MQQGCERCQLVNGTGQQKPLNQGPRQKKIVQAGWVPDTLFFEPHNIVHDMWKSAIDSIINSVWPVLHSSMK